MSVHKILTHPSCFSSQHYLLTPDERIQLYRKIHPKHLLSYDTLVFRDLKDVSPQNVFDVLDFYPIPLHIDQRNTLLRFYHLLCIEFQIEEFYLGNCCMDILLNYKPNYYDIYLLKFQKINYESLQGQHDLYKIEESDSWYRVNQFYMNKNILKSPSNLYTYYDNKTKTLWGRRDFLFLYYCGAFRKYITLDEVTEEFKIYNTPGNLKFKH